MCNCEPLIVFQNLNGMSPQYEDKVIFEMYLTFIGIQLSKLQNLLSLFTANCMD